MVFSHDCAESSVVNDHMRPRANHAHVSAKNIKELRNFIEAGLSKDPSHRINPRIARGGLLGSIIAFVSAHRPKLKDAEGQIVEARPCLSIEERTGRLNRLQNLHHQAEWRQNKQDYRETHQNFHHPFDGPIYRIFQRLIPQTDKFLFMKIEVRDVVTEDLSKIVENQKPD